MTEIYHIDEPNQPYEVSDKEAGEGYFYVILYHPSAMDIKLLRDWGEGEVWFRTRKECLLARVNRYQRKLDYETTKLRELKKKCKEGS